MDEVLDHLRAEIGRGAFATGSKLPPEARLTTQLGVSRTTLREAIVVLTHEGLVDVRHGDGTYVREPKPAWSQLAARPIAALVELYQPLYLELTRLASSRATEQEVKSLSTLTSRLADALGAGMPAALDLAVATEATVAGAAHSPLIAEVALGASAAIQPTRVALPPEVWLAPLQQLLESLAGVVSRDAESADRPARLWLASQAALIVPNSQQANHVAREARRGPRARHASPPDSQAAG